MSYVTVSAKIRKELLEKLKMYNYSYQGLNWYDIVADLCCRSVLYRSDTHSVTGVVDV